MGRVFIQLNTEQVEGDVDSKIMLANRLLIEDIYERALPRTPMASSNLRHNVIRRVEGKNGIIEWEEPYASYQERGERWDGSHKVKHYTTPGTGKDFAKNAVNEALADVERYYEGLI